MSHRSEGIDVWTCDLCGRSASMKLHYGYPKGWGDVQFFQPPGHKRKDLCPTCVSSFVAFLSKLEAAGPAPTPAEDAGQ